MSDLHFAKKGTFYHSLKNNHDDKLKVELVIQEYFPHYIKPQIHTLRIYKKDINDQITELSLDEFDFKIVYDE